MLHFQHIEYFWLLLLIPLAILLFVRITKWKKSVIRKIGDAKMIGGLIEGDSPKIFKTKFIFITIAMILCIIAVAGLIIPDKSEAIPHSGTDMMVVLDVSNSMLSTDVKPDRLTRAKQLIARIIDARPGDQIGLVIFAGRAYLQMPLTLDHEASKMYISVVSPKDIAIQGTVIKDALQMAQAVFNPNDATLKSILLISDGEDHDNGAVATAKELGKDGIMINTVGIGSPNGAPVPDETSGGFKVDEQGNRVISKLNEDELKKIAQAGNGIYLHFMNVEGVAQKLEAQLGKLEKHTIQSDSSYKSLKQYYWYFLLLAFALLVVEPFLHTKKKMNILKGVFTSLFFVMLAGDIGAQTVNKDIYRGNQLFNNQRFEEAINAYKKTIDQSRNSDIANFNTGNAYFRDNKPEDAVRSYDQAIETTKDKELQQQSYYNKGVALQKMQQSEQSIDAYKKALLLNPDDEQARQNLQRLLQQQQRQQNNKDNQDKDKNQKQDQDKNDQKQNNSSVSRKDAEEKLKALAEKERELQDKMRQSKRSTTAPLQKDW